MKQFDPAKVNLFTELFASIAEEMGSVLERVSFSPNIKERRDYSCAIFDLRGKLISQAAHIPVHLGAMEFLMTRWLADGPAVLNERFYVTNDPYFAGTHLPDISVIRSVEVKDKRVGYVASRAHHADIGGTAPGSFAPAEDIRSEGHIIPPQELTEEAVRQIVSESRSKEERRGDLEAQRSSALIGAQRYTELAERYGEQLPMRISECMSYAEEVTRAALRSIPAGEYQAQDTLEDTPEEGNRVRIKAKLISDGCGRVIFDFSGTDGQQPIGINATEAVTRSACYYVVRCLAPGAPTNSGCWAPVEVRALSGTLVNASFPAPVVAGNTETSQRIVDVLLQALAKALPKDIPACSQGTMNNIAIGARDWAYYETIGGGAGAGPTIPGADAVHTHMTNTRNTPAEALEIELPLRVTRYELRKGSGGAGRHSGGEGTVRELRCLAESATLSLMTERRSAGPPGAGGGSPGLAGCNTLIREGEEQELPSKALINLRKGDAIRIETPGGGGWGDEP